MYKWYEGFTYDNADHDYNYLNFNSGVGYHAKKEENQDKEMYTNDEDIHGNFTTSINFANPLNSGLSEAIVGRTDT